MKILVTGGAGFLGSALIAELKKRGHYVRALLRRQETAFNLDGLEVEIYICNLLDKEKLELAVRNIEVIFHTAAIYKGYPFYIKYPKEIYQTNLEGTRNLFDVALKSGVKKIIYTSSTAAIGMPEDNLPADETVKLNFLNKRSHYEKSKALAEEIALSYHSKGMYVVAVNPSFLFGVRDSRPTPTGEMVIKFLNRSYPCYFDALLCVSDIDTVVQAHIKALENGKSGERYIVAYEQHYTLKEIFDMLESITGVKRPWIKLPLQWVYLFSIVNELLLGIIGLGSHVKPLIASEIVSYFKLGAKYNGLKARREFGLTEKPFKEVLSAAVKWYVLNGYIRKTSKIAYFKKIGKLK